MKIVAVTEALRVIESGSGERVAKITRTAGWRWTLIVVGREDAPVDATRFVNAPDEILATVKRLRNVGARERAEEAFE